MGEDPMKYNPGAGGTFQRTESAFRNFISRDPQSRFPAAKGRYALYLSPGCPWSHRTMIARVIKGLEDIIDLYICHTAMGPDGWYFTDDPSSAAWGSLPADPVYGFKTIKQLYLKADPTYTGRVTVPVLWDKKGHTMVSNESSEILRMFYTEFDHLLPAADREASRALGGFYPPALRREIDALNDWVYHTVNNGVYKTGFAASQRAYEDNVDAVFASLDRLERLLGDPAHQPFLFGEGITDADIRLFPTIVRFDTAYVPVFLCNLGTIRDNYPALHRWVRRLYWDQGERTRGAFYKTTQPWIDLYREGYANARPRVLGITGPLIVPRGPRVPILELDAKDRLE